MILVDLAPEIVLAIGLLAVVASYILARALIYIWEYTFGAMLKGIASVLPGGWKFFGHTIVPDTHAAFLHLEAGIFHSLQNWATSSEHAIAGVWHAMGAVWRWSAGISEWLAKETAHTFEWLIHVRTPKITRALILAAFPVAFLSRLIAAQIARLLPHVGKIVHVVEHTITHTIVHTVEKAGAVVLPGTLGIPRLWKEIHGFTKRFARIHWRLHRLEALLGVTGMAIAMARVFGLPNWRCLTRGNVGRTVRHLCGLPSHLLDDLLGLLVDVLIVEDICQVITLLTEGLGIIQGPINTLVGTLEGALCHGDYGAPATVDPSGLSLPPVTGLTLSLG